MDIGHQTPVDRVAARISQKGIGYTPASLLSSLEKDPTMRGGWQHYSADKPVAMVRWQRANPQDVDLTGKRYGRLVVAGVCTENDSVQGGRRWWCRCDCGAYQSRKRSGLQKGTTADLMCARCLHTERIKGGWRGITPMTDAQQRNNAITARRKRIDLLEAEADRLRQEIKQLQSTGR